MLLTILYRQYSLLSFSSQTSEEFSKIYHGYRYTKTNRTKYSLPLPENIKQEPPDSLDWRAEGAVTPVKDQVSIFSHCANNTRIVIKIFEFKRSIKSKETRNNIRACTVALKVAPCDYNM